MSAVDQAFVKAISTIKALSRSPSGLAKPPPESRTTLYGLYKQATEGDVEGIMPRPAGNSLQDEANRRKWDAWRAQAGMSRQEAKIKYIEFLLATMRSVSSTPISSQPLLVELAEIYEIAKNNGDASELNLPGPRSLPPPSSGQPHTRAASVASNHSAYGQFLRRPTYSEFGLSERDRTEQMSERGTALDRPGAPESVGDVSGDRGAPGPVVFGAEDTSIDANTWKQDVAWQLETISEEINSMRRRYNPPPAASPTPSAGAGKAPGPARPDPSKTVAWIVRFLEGALSVSSRWIYDLMRRAAYDTAVLVVLLAVVRIVRGNPSLMKRLPLTRKLFTIFGNIIAVILREVGFDIRTISVRGGSVGGGPGGASGGTT